MEAKGRDASLAPAPPAAIGTLTEAPRRKAGGTKRKSSGSSSAPAKRQAKERSLLHHVFPAHNGPCTRARQSPLKHGTAGAQKPPEHAGAPAWASEAGGKDESSVGGPIKEEEEEVIEEPLVDKEFEAVRSRGANVHAVPTPAGWFSWKLIHPVEKHMLPSFFNRKHDGRTPQVYMHIRNSMLKKFHSNPQTQVELKDFNELSVGDADARQEVFEFLDHWGLINFHPFLPSMPESSKSDGDDGDRMSSSVYQLYQFETIHPFPRKKEEHLAPKTPPSLLLESSLVDDLVRPVGPSVEYHCNSCSADCSRKRYHCQKQVSSCCSWSCYADKILKYTLTGELESVFRDADFDLCSDCFNDGKFGTGMAQTDFILMESAEAPGSSGGSWTDQETLLLLEALELFGENWNEIAEHVATKTKAQCIFHFLQMPIEDSFLENDGDGNDNNLDSKDQTPNKESTTTSTSELMEIDKKEYKESSPTDAPVIETKNVDSSDNIKELRTSKTNSLMYENADDNNSHEDGASLAVDVLKAAFQAVGYFTEQGQGSFAEAGNPVMALAAFLSGIVDSHAVIPSCRSSLKAMSEDSPSIQLATRHCFLLEDPPVNSKDPSVCVSSAGTETMNNKCQKDERKMKMLDALDESEDQEIIASLENDENSSILLQDSTEKQIDEKEIVDESPSKSVSNIVQESVDQSLSLSEKQSTTSNTKGVTDVGLAIDPTPVVTKETKHLTSQGEAPKIQEKENSDSRPVAEKQNSMKNSDDLPSSDIVHQQTDSANGADKTKTLVVLQRKECMETGGSIEETKKKADDYEKKESRTDDEKNINPNGRDGDCNVDTLKRAAVTALSAASVKAKLLAKLEEEEIRKLATLIIEKQLHKLEMKLSLFTDIENVVLRMREQTEKARNRLMFERSQIVAATLGLSRRTNPASSRLPMDHGPTGPRPLNVTAQMQPPLRRP